MEKNFYFIEIMKSNIADTGFRKIFKYKEGVEPSLDAMEEIIKNIKELSQEEKTELIKKMQKSGSYDNLFIGHHFYKKNPRVYFRCYYAKEHEFVEIRKRLTKEIEELESKYYSYLRKINKSEDEYKEMEKLDKLIDEKKFILDRELERKYFFIKKIIKDDVDYEFLEQVEDFNLLDLNRMEGLLKQGNKLAFALCEDYRGSSHGNGYDGYSMSNNACEAYEHLQKPLSKFNKEDLAEFMHVFNLNFKATLKEFKQWLKIEGFVCEHHTSKYYNTTRFYSVKEALKINGFKALEKYFKNFKIDDYLNK